MRQLSFYPRNLLCTELFRNLQFSIPQLPSPSLNYCSVRGNICVFHKLANCCFGKSLGFLSVNLIYFGRLQFRVLKPWDKAITTLSGEEQKCRAIEDSIYVFGVKRRKTSVSKLVSNCIVTLIKQWLFYFGQRKFLESNNPWLILSSMQGLCYKYSRCFGIQPWFWWTLERRISWPKW